MITLYGLDQHMKMGLSPPIPHLTDGLLRDARPVREAGPASQKTIFSIMTPALLI